MAREAGLTGSVRNDSSGVTIEAFGTDESLDVFVRRLESSPPPAAAIRRIRWQPLPPAEHEGFTIVHSEATAERRVSIPPDLATCGDCLSEVLDPLDRRHGYPFTNCTNCGPRFTITLDVPYDRPATTMAGFTMCDACRSEYESPEDRRFHAQPNACPVCGPRLALMDPARRALARDDEALLRAAVSVRDGRILALRGLGGFLLLVDARDDAAVARLRRRKARHEKPLALMAADLDQARKLCQISDAEACLLTSPQAPIVLLRRRRRARVADAVAPGNPWLGVMLPYTPLHHLLLRELGSPVVATSGNLSDEPIAIDNEEALARLGGIADLFLVHDRPIARHADDSVALVLEDVPRLLRRARGFAPAPVALGEAAPPILAVGGHLKNTIAVGAGDTVFISQHIGDMETPEAIRAFQAVIRDLLTMCRIEPVAVAHDLHPDYASTCWAREAAADSGGSDQTVRLPGARLIGVQHHHAHLASCLADNAVGGTALGVTWDGTGYGTDGTIWGGEFLLGDAAGFRRFASLRPFRLPGGDAAVREPRRAALALLWELLGERALGRDDLPPVRGLAAAERGVLGRMLGTGLRAPVTTSAGRLFDGVAALLDLHQRVSFEGQAAMALEFAADPAVKDGYPLGLARGGEAAPDWIVDWRPLLEALLEDLRRGVPVPTAAARFHHGLARGILDVAAAAGEPRVALSGGCFQNRLLTARASSVLRQAGFEVLLHRQVPANDGGLSLGQVAVAAARLRSEGAT